MTTEDERRGALEAVERIVNRGENVVDETLAALRRLYPAVALVDGRFSAPALETDDEALLERARVLVSAHLPPRKTRSVFRG